jgi:hypothetical protein
MMRSRLLAICGLGLTALAIVVAIPASALAAGVINAPEIDGSTVAAGLAGVAAGTLIVRSLGRRN